jgi:hypothetical protein
MKLAKTESEGVRLERESAEGERVKGRERERKEVRGKEGERGGGGREGEVEREGGRAMDPRGKGCVERGTSLARNRPPYEPTVGLCLGPDGGPIGVAVSFELGTPVPPPPCVEVQPLFCFFSIFFFFVITHLQACR